MADLPILFSAPMVRAILREIEQPGTGKTQTRRIWTLPKDHQWSNEAHGIVIYDGNGMEYGIDELRCRYAVGDRVWVRERHHRTNDSAASHLVGYDFADGPITREDRHHVAGAGDVQFFRHSLGGWGGRASRNFPGIHMPRWASRLTLTVTDVRVQRLQEIGDADAIAEGAEVCRLPGMDGGVMVHTDNPGVTVSPGRWFRQLWDSLNAARGFGWDANPWVAAYTFVPVLGNIDQVQP